MYRSNMSGFEYDLVRGQPGFSVRFLPCTRESHVWKEELKAAARSFAAAQGSLWLGLSGGIGSEAMCQTFFEEGVNFNVLTVEDAAGSNSTEVRRAQRWCYRHGLHCDIVRLDFLSFFKEAVPRYRKEGFLSSSATRYFQLKLLELIEERGGVAVLGGGDLLYRVRYPNQERMPEGMHGPYLRFGSNYVLMYEWNRMYGKSHVPLFFTATPELCQSYVNLPLVRAAIETPALIRSLPSLMQLRRLVYHSTIEGMSRRSEYTSVKMWDRLPELRTLVKEQASTSDVCRIPMDEFERQLAVQGRVYR